MGAQGEKAGADQVFLAFQFAGGGQQVAGDLLLHELVIGFVFVEALNDVVAVAPGEGEREIAATADGIGVAGHVEPVPAPAFAEAFGGQQAVNRLFVGLWRAILEESVQFVSRGEQAGQIEGKAAQKGGLVRRRRGRQPLGFDLAQDEPVNVGWLRFRIFDSRRFGCHRPRVGPFGARLGQIELPLLQNRTGARVGRAHGDPFFQVLNGGLRQFAAGGHLPAFMLNGFE